MIKPFSRTALAIALALSSGAICAQNVAIVGVVDTGLRYSRTDSGIGEAEHTLSMQGAGYTNNRIIFLGKEELTPSLKTGFFLESGFNSDSGDADGMLLFKRAAYLYLDHQDYGILSGGRFGMLRSGATPRTANILGDRIHPLGSIWPSTDWPMYAMPFFGYSTSNVMQWDTPKVGGLRAAIQYAMGGDDGGTENKSNTARYGAAALTYDGEVIEGVLLADCLNEATPGGATDRKDAWTVTLGGNVRFEAARAFGFVQYFRDANGSAFVSLPGISGSDLFTGCDRIRGFAGSLGVTVPALAGKVHLAGTYMDAKSHDEAGDAQNDKLERYGVTAAYEYSLSKRTTLYTIAAYWKDKAEGRSVTALGVDDPSVLQISAGICHTF